MTEEDQKPENVAAPAEDTTPVETPVEAEVAAPKTALEAVVAEAESATPAKKGRGKLEYKEIDPKDVVAGMLIRVHQKIIDTNTKGEDKERIQVFQGMVLAHKHGHEAGATITVRKVTDGIGVERIYPLNMPSIAKIEMVRRYQVKQARPYYLRAHKKKLTEMA